MSDTSKKIKPAEIQQIDLTQEFGQIAQVEFLFAETHPEVRALARVVYAFNGEEVGTRLDLDKQVFLDHSDDPAVNDILTCAASQVSEYIYSQRPSNP